MSDDPKQFKTTDEYTAEEHEKRQAASRRGEEAPRFETDAYKERRAEVLAKAGLNDDPDRDE